MRRHWRRRKSDSKSSQGLASLRLSVPLRERSLRFDHSIRTLRKPCSFRDWSAFSHIGDHVPVSTISASGSHAHPCPTSALPESLGGEHERCSRLAAYATLAVTGPTSGIR